MRAINKLLLKLPKRAERATNAQLVASFTDAGSLLASLANNDHQIIFGRRGTGKTHVLSKLFADAIDVNDLAIQVDLRTVGSTGGIYADPTLPLSERATRLIADLLGFIHDGLMAQALDDDSVDLGSAQRTLDAFRVSIAQVSVVGQVVDSATASAQRDSSASSGLDLSLSGNAKIGINFTDQQKEASASGRSTVTTGVVRHRLVFGNVAAALRDVCGCFGGRTLWLLLDEWSEIPLDLQPYLADLLRRTIFPVRDIVVKIAAIEQRTNFQIQPGDGSSIGIEIGADAAASLTLDDFMVFDNNAASATAFFRSLLWKHVRSSAPDDGDGSRLKTISEQEFVSEAFTQINALQELVRAAEGVPRDAINVMALAAQAAADRAISVSDIRSAARQWYQQSKETAVGSRELALDLLHWIRENVIGERRARAFLLPSSTKSELVDYLYDSRVIHVIKKGVSSNETRGVRYNVYAIDYGCYVDLISTTSAPQGLFEAEYGDGDSGFVQVPATDYRSIRRAILNLAEFEVAASNDGVRS